MRGEQMRPLRFAALKVQAGLPVQALLTAVVLAAAGCQAKPAPAPGAGAAGGALPVTTVAAESQNVAVSGEWVGTLDGFVNAQIQPQVSGYLIKQTYQEGQQVAKGQVLFEIDPRPLQAALAQAQGQLQQARGQVDQARGTVGQAQAQLGLTQINVKRDAPLAEARAIAQSQLDNDKQQVLTQQASVASAQASVAAAQAQVQAATAAVETAKLNLGFTHVRSLIAGVAGQAQMQVGNLVNPQSVLTSVSQVNPIKVFFSISDAEYLALASRGGQDGGSDLLRSSANLPITLTLANGTTYPHIGHIVFVDRQVNQQTGAIRIAAAFENPGNLLRPGGFGRVKATTGMLRNVVVVPQAAVTELQGIEQVAIVQNGKVHIQNIELGPQTGANWVVKSGLAPGAQVITDQLQKLREGMSVNAHAANQPAAATFDSTQTAGSEKAGR